MIYLLLGLAVGSFLAAFTYRVASGVSWVRGRSFCPLCKAKIVWFDNIPLFSFILLKGKCRSCRKTISWRYPAIELAGALGFILIGFNPYLLIMYSLLLAIFVIDLENQIIPDELIVTGIILSLFRYSFYINFLAGFAASLFLLLIHLFTRGRGMGLGDVKFALLGGMILGFPLFILWLFLSFLTGAVAGIILMLTKHLKLKDKIAFGPYLVMSLVATYLWGEKLIIQFFQPLL